jgi:hypothetical protein
MFGSMTQSPKFNHKDSTIDRRGRFELLNDGLDHIQLDDPDAELIARTRTLLPYVPVKILTYDIGLALRARATGLDVLRLEYHDLKNE